MAFCKNCGEKLEDGTNFCPKCGNSIEVNCNNENPQSSIDNNGNEMTKAQKGGAGCLTVFIAISGLSLLIQGNIISGIAAIAAVVALVYLQMGKINKKYAWTVMIAAFIGFLVVGAATAEDKPSTKQVTSTQKETTESERQAKQQKEPATEQPQEAEKVVEQKKEEMVESQNNSIYGIYEITDKVGCTIRLTLNEDKTATITGVRGEGITYYCSWEIFSGLKRGIGIAFSDEKPYLVYEGGPDNDKYASLYLKEGWLYSGPENVDSKNPRWRLKATKIK